MTQPNENYLIKNKIFRIYISLNNFRTDPSWFPCGPEDQPWLPGWQRRWWRRWWCRRCRRMFRPSVSSSPDAAESDRKSSRVKWPSSSYRSPPSTRRFPLRSRRRRKPHPKLLERFEIEICCSFYMIFVAQVLFVIRLSVSTTSICARNNGDIYNFNHNLNRPNTKAD